MFPKTLNPEHIRFRIQGLESKQKLEIATCSLEGLRFRVQLCQCVRLIVQIVQQTWTVQFVRWFSRDRQVLARVLLNYRQFSLDGLAAIDNLVRLMMMIIVYCCFRWVGSNILVEIDSISIVSLFTVLPETHRAPPHVP